MNRKAFSFILLSMLRRFLNTELNFKKSLVVVFILAVLLYVFLLLTEQLESISWTPGRKSFYSSSFPDFLLNFYVPRISLEWLLVILGLAVLGQALSPKKRKISLVLAFVLFLLVQGGVYWGSYSRIKDLEYDQIVYGGEVRSVLTKMIGTQSSLYEKWLIWRFSNFSHIQILKTGSLQGLVALAARKGKRKVISLLAKKGVKFESDSLNAAIRSGFPEIVKILLREGVDPNGLSSGDRNIRPLDLAIQYGRLESVKDLIRYGGKIFLERDPGYTRLMMSNDHGQSEISQFFIESGDPSDPRSKLSEKLDGKITRLVQLPLHRGYVVLGEFESYGSKRLKCPVYSGMGPYYSACGSSFCAVVIQFDGSLDEQFESPSDFLNIDQKIAHWKIEAIDKISEWKKNVDPESGCVFLKDDPHLLFVDETNLYWNVRNGKPALVDGLQNGFVKTDLDCKVDPEYISQVGLGFHSCFAHRAMVDDEGRIIAFGKIQAYGGVQVRRLAWLNQKGLLDELKTQNLENRIKKLSHSVLGAKRLCSVSGFSSVKGRSQYAIQLSCHKSHSEVLTVDLPLIE